MQCPECGADRCIVGDSYPYAGSVFRRRKCQICGFGFFTVENEAFDYDVQDKAKEALLVKRRQYPQKKKPAAKTTKKKTTKK